VYAKIWFATALRTCIWSAVYAPGTVSSILSFECFCFLKTPGKTGNSGHSVTPHGRGLYLALKTPRGGQGARLVVWLLYNASGWCNWWLVVCGHCVVVLGGSSEIGCLLVVNWMSVEIACVANWLFFLFLYFVRRVCTTLPSPRFGVGF